MAKERYAWIDLKGKIVVPERFAEIEKISDSFVKMIKESYDGRTPKLNLKVKKVI